MSVATAPLSIAALLSDLLDGRDLSSDRMSAVMEELLAGTWGAAEVAALLIALRAKGETAEELAAAAGVMRRHAQPLDAGRDDLLDTCGTGGDGAATFNISTATALVVAGAGVPVVKHGNRGVSSASGSADVLAHLGVQMTADAGVARRCLDEAGMVFCFAPAYHPAMRHVGDVRRRLGVRTLFNCLGPLANPAGAAYQLLGVGRPEWLDRMAGALVLLGTRRSVLVHGRDGLDEVSPAAPTLVRIVEGGRITTTEWTPADFGVPNCSLADLRADGPAESAAIIRDLLAGRAGPAVGVVVANAGAALIAAGRAASPAEGAEIARRSLATGKAAAVLAALVRITSVCLPSP
jgi:anthranilate phosphoribosyltransferase